MCRLAALASISPSQSQTTLKPQEAATPLTAPAPAPAKKAGKQSSPQTPPVSEPALTLEEKPSVCLTQVLELINCVTAPKYDEPACVNKLRALRECALKHGIKQFSTQKNKSQQT